MSARFIAVTDLSWSTPDGRKVFNDLNLTFGPERTGVIGRNGVGKSTLLRLIAGELKPQAGAIRVGGRLAALRQSVQARPDETIADLFGAREGLAILRRAADGQATEGDLASADWTLEERIASAMEAMGLSADPALPLGRLSGGQRTRAALAALVFSEPDFVLLDEPTNNLDREGRQAVADMVEGWRGGALVVSHDRGLLEGLDAIVELTSLGAARYGGGWSAYRARKAVELEALEQDLATADRRVAGLARAHQAQGERQARRDSAGRRKAARGDMPKILLGARKNRAEATSGDQARLAERQMAQAREAAEAARARVEVLAPLTVDIASTGLAAGKDILRLEGLSVGYRSDQPVLSDLDLTVSGPERLAITGANGSGKSTLLATIAGALPPLAGRVWLGVRPALLDQNASLLAPEATILENFRRLNPGAGETACRAALARFRFRADAALQTVGSLSGGQLLRAALACVIGGPDPTPLLILDEPTNHLDTESIEAVEAGLNAFDGALIVVSHDRAFLDAIGIQREIELIPTRSSLGGLSI